ncbi:7950_t:CDS:2 [Entrophospora sp. SA101]|nr:7950_t:CDS:2 [Entrophospora sp. SA101]
MDDSELQAIRQARLRELQAQNSSASQICVKVSELQLIGLPEQIKQQQRPETKIVVFVNN